MTDGGQRGGGLLLLGALRVWPLLRGSADMGVSCPPQSSVSILKLFLSLGLNTGQSLFHLQKSPLSLTL